MKNGSLKTTSSGFGGISGKSSTMSHGDCRRKQSPRSGQLCSIGEQEASRAWLGDHYALGWSEKKKNFCIAWGERILFNI